ncbi:response regulator transcription factor [Microbacterium sp. W1N]|uniref:response regulator transcription factor n=1 Tax=Microbacterium festucae TaxID=2977531 RepID=UPI0021BF575D|nr:response regulator transcription factor [Microbacterium festucae]MCT9819290.1 response regulator transcription factor [Microbacterium festucae]
MTGSPKRIRVLIADDNRAVRRGLRVQLENAPGISVIGEVSNGRDAVLAARNERADVVLMDIQMPEQSGIAATRELMLTSDEQPVAVIVMTSFAVDGYVTEALDAGAVGYLLKSLDSTQVVDAIFAAANGEAIVSTHVTAPVLREFVRRRPDPIEPDAIAALSAAERRVVSVLSSGVTSNEDIAKELQVSVHTVRSQLQSALKKLGLNDRTQLALWGAKHHLAAAPPHSSE